MRSSIEFTHELPESLVARGLRYLATGHGPAKSTRGGNNLKHEGLVVYWSAPIICIGESG